MEHSPRHGDKRDDPERNGARSTRTPFSLPLKQGQAPAVFLASAWEVLAGRIFCTDSAKRVK